MDSGLQTTSPLNFTTGLLADDPQTITSFLKNANELPNLTGRHVEFTGLGWVRSAAAGAEHRQPDEGGRDLGRHRQGGRSELR